MQNDKNDGFRYAYSASEQKELEQIRKKYLPSGEDKLERIRRLDAGVYKRAGAIALTLGIIGALIMGAGMSLVMTELGAFLGEELSFALGIGIGLLGIVALVLAYPVYNAVLKSERKRVAPEILMLIEELTK